MRALSILPVLLIPFIPFAQADTIRVDAGDDAVVVRSPMKEGNFLMRLPAGFAESKAEAPWQKSLEKDGIVVRLRIEKLAGDKLSLPVLDLATPRAKKLGDLTLDGAGGARRIGKGKNRIALFVRDGKRFYEVVVDLPENNAEAEKLLRAALDGFTLLDPKGAPEAAADPEAQKPKTLEHDYYKIAVLKPQGFTERPPDVEGDKGIWKHLRRIDEKGNSSEIRVRVHLASAKNPKKADALVRAAMKRFETKFNDVRIPKRPKLWRVRSSKEAWQVQMAGRVPKSGVIVHADYRTVLHENGRLYEFDMFLFGNAKRAFAKDVKAFWKSIRLKGK
ncbi:MAG: hypothetical protein ACYTGZ_02640 [Planctomycetota bacterium]